MTNEFYISFETAKLLRDTDFDGFCYHVWSVRDGAEPKLLHASSLEDGVCLNKSSLMDIEAYENKYDDETLRYYLAPTQSMVLRWLREEKGIYVDVFIDDESDMPWVYNVYRKKEEGLECMCHHNGEFFSLSDGYEQAAEAGIVYSLKSWPYVCDGREV